MRRVYAGEAMLLRDDDSAIWVVRWAEPIRPTQVMADFGLEAYSRTSATTSAVTLQVRRVD